ncbi:MAG: PfkB family carbohydrate kinase [Planctomycetota bacterium]
MSERAALLAAMKGRKIAVLGDLIADCYVETHPERLSREAPVLILKYERHRFKPGCAANTVMNLHALGADVTPFGFLGNDDAGIAVRDAFQEAGIPVQGIVTSGATTQKVRLVSGDVARPKQQILRLDLDNVCDDATVSANLDEVVRRGGFDGIVVSDYLLGVATPARLATLREASPDALVSIDARAGLDRYPDVDLVTPNDGEAAVALARPVVTDDEATSGALELRERLRARAILLTRGNQGMLLADGETHRIAISGPSEIVDPSGAGDTVVAVAALARVAGANYLQAAHLANVAAGISVMKVGPASVTPAEILEAVHG